MTNSMNEQQIRLEVIKSLIMSGATNMLRGNFYDEIARRADPMVEYIMGARKKEPKPKAKTANPSKDGPAATALEKN